ncbi:ESCRT-0 subunit protein hse1 [Geranomyces variabilis]|uniref:ESCRT-0 subunit protein hse1 n=1 Tax=Geranomyces variabilis TaxID=109894 RepID=A0AAD5TRF7_9FUNG|nr:ESCRT-0 subunit protein hse1 [Geranomyces variabilis]
MTSRQWMSEQTLSVLVTTLATSGLDVTTSSPAPSAQSAPLTSSPAPQAPSAPPSVPFRTPFGAAPPLPSSNAVSSAIAAPAVSAAAALSSTAPGLPRRFPTRLDTPPDSRSVSPAAVAQHIPPQAYKMAFDAAVSSHNQKSTLPNVASLSLGGATKSPVAPPVAARPTSRRTVIAIEDHVPSEDGDLAFSKGDIVTVLDDVDENWYRGSFRGQSGIFPKSFVQARN